VCKERCLIPALRQMTNQDSNVCIICHWTSHTDYGKIREGCEKENKCQMPLFNSIQQYSLLEQQLRITTSKYCHQQLQFDQRLPFTSRPKVQLLNTGLMCSCTSKVTYIHYTQRLQTKTQNTNHCQYDISGQII